MDFDPWRSYRAAARALGEAEGGRRFYTVIEAVDLLRATASEEAQDGPQVENGTSAPGSGSGSGRREVGE